MGAGGSVLELCLLDPARGKCRALGRGCSDLEKHRFPVIIIIIIAADSTDHLQIVHILEVLV